MPHRLPPSRSHGGALWRPGPAAFTPPSTGAPGDDARARAADIPTRLRDQPQQQEGSEVDMTGNRTRADAVITVHKYEPAAYDEPADGPVLTRIHVEESFSGDISGDGVVEFLQAARADGSASFVGIERVTGTVGTAIAPRRFPAVPGTRRRSGRRARRLPRCGRWPPSGPGRRGP